MTLLNVVSVKASRLLIIEISILCFLWPSILCVFILGWPLQNYSPTNSDEVMYYHEAISFATHGLSMGYNTINEVAAPWASLPFGSHGPWFGILLGEVLHFFPRDPLTVFIFQSFLIAFGVFIYLSLIKPTNRQLVFVALIVLSFWPWVIYSLQTMQESLHFCLVFIVGAFLQRIIKGDKPISTIGWLILGSILIFASLFRLSWLLILNYLPFLSSRGRRYYVVLAKLCLTFCFSWLVVALNHLSSSPFPGEAFLFLKILTGERALTTVFPYAKNNIALFFQATCMPESFMRVTTVVLLLSIVIAFMKSFRAGNTYEWKNTIFHCVNLGGILSLCLFFYYFSRLGDYRILSMHILLSMLVAYPCKFQFEKRIIAVPLLVNLLMSLPSKDLVVELSEKAFSSSRNAVAQFRNVFGASLVFDIQSDNKWCNTVFSVMRTEEYAWAPLTAIPEGMGVSFLEQDNKILAPFKSKYILVNRKSIQPDWLIIDPVSNLVQFEIENFVKAKGQLLAQNNSFVLFLNDNTTCDRGRSNRK